MTPSAARPRSVLVTRPAHQAASLMTLLALRGFTPIAAPVLALRTLEAVMPSGPVDALVFTSANGVAAFAARDARRDLTVFAVGPATAAAARMAQFQRIVAGDTGARDLAALIASQLPRGSLVLYPSARDIAFDLGPALAEAGIRTSRVVVYEMDPAEALPQPALDAIQAGCIAVFHSRRSLEVFAGIASGAGLSLANVLAVQSGADWLGGEPRGFRNVLTLPAEASEKDIVDSLDRLEAVRPHL